MCYSYPKKFQALNMKANDVGKTVHSTDMLAPGIKEPIIGSTREETPRNSIRPLKTSTQTRNLLIEQRVQTLRHKSLL